MNVDDVTRIVQFGCVRSAGASTCMLQLGRVKVFLVFPLKSCNRRPFQ